MAAKRPSARDSVLVFSDAAGIEHTLIIGSPEWYRWLADAQQRSFEFACPAGSFQARKERKQRGGWYWIAYRRVHGKIHKRYLGKPDELSLARLLAAAQLLEQSAPSVAQGVPVDPSASPMNRSPAPPPYILTTKLFVPPLRSNVVARPRLIEQLQAGAQGRLTLLSAPAGFGKTTLLSAWLASRSAELRVMSSELLLTEQTQNSKLKTQNLNVGWV